MTGPRRPPVPATEAAHAELARRARALARDGARVDDAATAATAATAVVSVVVARRGAGAFGVRSADVRDVRRTARLSPLPGSDRPVAGIAAWRGQGIVVHDPLGDGARAPVANGDDVDGGEEAAASWLLVVGERGSEFALLADDVSDVVDVPLDALVPAPEGALPSLGATADGLLLLDLRAWIALHSSS